ncbi:winged helix-turn-helix domain-containing protein [Gluconobacter kondonii]|uniref:winged helix-turn-helix domain-containing protein n=1 Tax=Gluconobacter kondonii TaxID=941463 RepID=UPI001B8D4D6D|nr:winged helix-turn-helix domain-containing protein [Gluconobacter kondonii]MBS1081399.1 winged helix-turn-helix transcriptional regulator [Gluconobacter kondonii]
MNPLPKILEMLRDRTPVGVIAKQNAVPKETVVLIWDQLFSSGIAAALAFGQNIENTLQVQTPAGRPSLSTMIAAERRDNILRLFKMGLGTSAIARSTGLTTATISYHRRRLEDAGLLPVSNQRKDK